MVPGRQATTTTVHLPSQSADIGAECAAILLALYRIGRDLFGGVGGVAEQLCREVARLTEDQAHLTLYWPSQHASTTSVHTQPATALPVQHQGVTYGQLLVACDPLHPGALAYPFAFCADLAATCAWLLCALEEHGLVRLQSQHLTQDLVRPLSPREHETLLHMAQGRDRVEIARQMGITPETVDSHREAIYRRLGVHSALDAVLLAHKLGLILLVAQIKQS